MIEAAIQPLMKAMYTGNPQCSWIALNAKPNAMRAAAVTRFARKTMSLILAEKQAFRKVTETLGNVVFLTMKRAPEDREVGIVERYFDTVVEDLYNRIETKIAVDEATGCWNWTGSKDDKGYGRVSFFKMPRQAYRVTYEMYVGPIPRGLCLDHLCRNPACVNPQHLEAVTLAENTRRGKSGESASIRNLAKTHCKRGHELTVISKTQRGCRVCLNENRRDFRRKIGLKGVNLAGLALGSAASVAVRLARTHCKHGHEWNAENTGRQRGNARMCKTCRRDQQRIKCEAA